MADDFASKVVIVTGAASGIGRATARAFAGRGASLVLADAAISRKNSSWVFSL